jgi:hypothetical protein
MTQSNSSSAVLTCHEHTVGQGAAAVLAVVAAAGHVAVRAGTQRHGGLQAGAGVTLGAVLDRVERSTCRPSPLMKQRDMDSTREDRMQDTLARLATKLRTTRPPAALARSAHF